MFLVWSKFLISALIIVIVGFKLSKYGDIIAEKSGLEKGWIGVVLLALVTSLPEVVTSLGAIVTEHAPDLALGNLFGSNLFNLFIIFAIDIAYKNGPILSFVSTSNILTASLGMISMLTVTFVMIYNAVAAKIVGDLPSFFGVGLGAILIMIIYFVSTRLSFNYEHGNKVEDTEEAESSSEYKCECSFQNAILFFLLLSVIIVFDGLWLVSICKDLSGLMNWGESFVGAIFMALATSLPELMVSLGAVAIGSVDMAMGNILGSNLFNMFIIVICDIAYTKGIFLRDIRIIHIIPALLALLMCAVVILGIVYKEKGGITKRKLSYVSLIIFFLYFIALFILYKLGLPI